MSKSINLEIVTIEDGYVVLEAEDGFQFELGTDMLPANLKEGRYLRFVISHTDYSPDKEEDDVGEIAFSKQPKTPNGRQLSY